MIWVQEFNVEDLQKMHTATMAGNLEIVFIEKGDDFIKAEMPINERSVQPYRIMHGGASAALAETVGSVASTLTVNTSKKRCVGLSLNVSHIRGVREGGKVIATARPFHLGRTTHVWDIQIHDERGKLTTASRLTMAVLDI